MPSAPHQLPTALQANARWELLGPSRVPAMLVHPDWDHGLPVPVLLWIHGRTARKELDPGRYLRLMRAGIGVCALDLPGHGERYEIAAQHPRHTLDLVLQMIDEVDEVVDALGTFGVFTRDDLALGGMSAGGMVSLARLCRPHPFRVVSVEATSGSWEHQTHRDMFRGRALAEMARDNPITNLGGWRELPIQAFHSRLDEWVAYEGQAAFIRALRDRYTDPGLIDWVVYDRTGAPYEHAGFGTKAAAAKNRQRDFLVRWLLDTDVTG